VIVSDQYDSRLSQYVVVVVEVQEIEIMQEGVSAGVVEEDC
jgi:hypothetical protein